MSRKSPTTRSIGSLLVVLALSAIGLWEALVPAAASDLSAENLELSAADDETLETLYGLTAVDVALLAGALAEGTDDSANQRYLVAGYPGLDRLDGPVWTRLTRPKQPLGDHQAKHLQVQPAIGGWNQLTPAKKAPSSDPNRLAGARVHLAVGGEIQPCPRLGLATFACGRPGWANVKRKKIQVDGHQSSCIWAHPLEGAETVIEFGRLHPQKGGDRLETALRDRVAGEKGAVDVEIDLGEHHLDHRHRPQRGWQGISLPKIDEPTPLTVGISAKHVGRRHFCFRLE